MRELDVLLSGYLNTRFAAANSERKQQFRDLLELSDPHIFALFTGRERSSDAGIQQIIDCILEQGKP